LKGQRFGVEIEMTGLTRQAAARIIGGYFGTDAVNVGGFYGTYTVQDRGGRTWKVMSDASITAQNRQGAAASDEYKVEVVTPICSYDDIEDIQEIIRKLRGGGARVHENCGIHVHVDAASHTPKTLRNIVNIVAAKEDLLYKALGVHVRREHYCRKTNTDFLDRINRSRKVDMDTFRQQWYRGYRERTYQHYHESRYHGLNLHSVFNKGTIEFRIFNSVMHAGVAKMYIQLSLAISHQALTQTRASHSKTTSSNEKYTFRTWLLHLGLIGKEFETARFHLLKNLEGNIAWRDPAQAEAQKQRLEAARLAKAIPPPCEAEECPEEETEGYEESAVLSM